MDRTEMRARVAAARVGHLATTRADGAPHVVVCCFALAEDTVWTVVDGKPKSTRNLQRLRNLQANPHASLLVDHYDDADWSRLWWVRVDGLAEVRDEAPPQVLIDKYAQYQADQPTGPLIALRIQRWTGWTAGPDDAAEPSASRAP